MTETIEREATSAAVKSDTPAVSHQPPKLLDQMRDRISGVQSPLDRIAA
jgi:hypothetical protein